MPEFRPALRHLALLLLAMPLLAAAAPPGPPGAAEDPVVVAREALRRKDKAQLAALRQQLLAAGHPLAQWVDYWELSNRLPEAQQAELNAFYTRWSGTYVEDRLRNDWLLELGKRRDWANFSVEFPRFRMNDDREVSCYALLTQHLAGQDVRSAALAAWFGQRELDDGCALLAQTLVAAGVLQADDAWHKARLAVEANRPRAARAAVALLDPAFEQTMAELADKPERWLARQPATRRSAADQQLQLLALMRMAGNDPDYTAGQLEAGWARRLGAPLGATAWAHVARQSALKQGPQATSYALQAWQVWDAAQKPAAAPAAVPWSDDLLAWQVRAALRRPVGDTQRWPLVQRAIDAMSAGEQRDATWVYWRARATLALARPGPEGDAARAAGQAALQGIAGQFSFYGKLATEELGGRTVLPAAPLPLNTAERQAPRRQPGFVRALQLIELGLRNEGVREWNFTLRGMGERELLGAAQWACEREVWDRCINTSERTKGEIDMAQRFPLPFREQVLARAGALGLEPALLFGLIRQESRFVADARSGAGAQGLMQVMPATAKWTARKVGLDYRPQMITDRDTNLHLGAAYLKRLLDEFDGSLAMAAAAYNAGPGRPRRWREGAPVEPAAWAESIPFTETRDYVKKVLSNSVYYAAMLGQAVPTLKARLGAPVGPRDPAAAPPDRELP